MAVANEKGIWLVMVTNDKGINVFDKFEILRMCADSQIHFKK